MLLLKKRNGKDAQYVNSSGSNSAALLPLLYFTLSWKTRRLVLFFPQIGATFPPFKSGGNFYYYPLINALPPQWRTGVTCLTFKVTAVSILGVIWIIGTPRKRTEGKNILGAAGLLIKTYPLNNLRFFLSNSRLSLASLHPFVTFGCGHTIRKSAKKKNKYENLEIEFFSLTFIHSLNLLSIGTYFLAFMNFWKEKS